MCRRGSRNWPRSDGKPVIRVLVVDDEDLVRSGLRMILEAQASIKPAEVASRSYFWSVL